MVHSRTSHKAQHLALTLSKKLILALTLTKLVLMAKDLISMLLDGLELFLGVGMTSSNSSKLKMAGVRRIYRPPSLVAVAPTVSRKSAYHRMNRCL